jgi:hypothetical protein
MKRATILSIIAVFGTLVSIAAIVDSSVNAQQYQSGGNTPSSSTPSSTSSQTTSNASSSSNRTNATAGGNLTGAGNMTNMSITK